MGEKNKKKIGCRFICVYYMNFVFFFLKKILKNLQKNYFFKSLLNIT